MSGYVAALPAVPRVSLRERVSAKLAVNGGVNVMPSMTPFIASNHWGLIPAREVPDLAAAGLDPASEVKFVPLKTIKVNNVGDVPAMVTSPRPDPIDSQYLHLFGGKPQSPATFVPDWKVCGKVRVVVRDGIPVRQVLKNIPDDGDFIGFNELFRCASTPRWVDAPLKPSASRFVAGPDGVYGFEVFTDVVTSRGRRAGAYMPVGVSSLFVVASNGATLHVVA
jgi:hypothetical protein